VHIYDAVIIAKYFGYYDILELLEKDPRYSGLNPLDARKESWDRYYKSIGMMR